MEQNTNNNPAAGERTFTQEEVNRIVGERLAKEKSKGEASFAEREQQFAERERELARREALADMKDQLKEMGLPQELLPVLNVQDKEALNTALEALKAHIEKEKNDNSQYKVYEPLKLPTGDLGHYGESTDYQIRKAMLHHE